MDDIDAELIEIVLIVDLVVSIWIAFLFVLFTQPPDDSMIPVYVGIGTFVVLIIGEILCRLFHIPAWIVKGLLWIRQKTDPEE